MGYYTELKLTAILNDNAPIVILEKLANGDMYEHITGESMPSIMAVADTPNLPIQHAFGRTHRWDQIFNPNTTILDLDNRTLSIKCDIKEYEDDYEKLVDWLKPYCTSIKAVAKGEDSDSWYNI